MSDFTLKWSFRGEKSKGSRVCVTARKKEIRSAAQRNRMRRLVKEFFRLHSSKFSAPLDMVVQVRCYKPFKYKELESIFKLRLKQSGVLE